MIVTSYGAPTLSFGCAARGDGAESGPGGELQWADLGRGSSGNGAEGGFAAGFSTVGREAGSNSFMVVTQGLEWELPHWGEHHVPTTEVPWRRFSIVLRRILVKMS